MNHRTLCLFALTVSIALALSAVHAQPDNKPKVQEPPVVEAPPMSAEAQALLEEVNPRIENIDTQQLQEILRTDPHTVLIDVRLPEETTLLGGSIDAPHHFNIPRGWVEFQVDSYITDKDRSIVVYCGINRRSPLAAEALMKLGYTRVKNYSDGFFAWQRQGLPVSLADDALHSFLYAKPKEVIPGVWSAIGATAPRTYDNSGHNNNLSFIIGDEGVLVFNAGDNYLLAAALHNEIRKITSQPVRYVVLENGQGHAMLGSSYWKEQGATIIAHEETLQQIRNRGAARFERMRNRVRDKSFNTEVVVPDRTFDEKLVIELGGETIEILYLGPAHSPGDIVAWLPERRLVIAGDMAFHERLLPVFDDTDTAGWIETWEKFAALDAEVVIPGHGAPTTMGPVTTYTRDYLLYMREQVERLLDEDGSLEDAYLIDQSAYAHLDTFFELSRSNAGQIFREMEFE
ncbi:MAG: MBL fold metallo-hydrolase [Gammaproteobacteria bacterium]|nr:MBL fold metallo-hydrolase [Gammaproteobacteria bacterium]